MARTIRDCRRTPRRNILMGSNPSTPGKRIENTLDGAAIFLFDNIDAALIHLLGCLVTAATLCLLPLSAAFAAVSHHPRLMHLVVNGAVAEI